MKEKISREVVRRNLVDNIKLGAGGIREVEFIVQTFQMMRGGRDKILQERSLLTVLPRLAELGLLNKDQIQDLRSAYLFFRQVENVLQAIDDKQTQTLPTDEQAQQCLILATQKYLIETEQGETWIEHSIQTWADFLQVLEKYQKKVRAVFSELIGQDETENEPLVNGKIALWKDILSHEMREEDLASVLKEYAVAESDYAEIFAGLLQHCKIGCVNPLVCVGVKYYERYCQRCLTKFLINRITLFCCLVCSIFWTKSLPELPIWNCLLKKSRFCHS